MKIHRDGMEMLKVLNSKHDASVNYVNSDVDVGYLETRLVRRDKHDIIYLSSQTGCKWGCKFCHLTATGQTKFVNTESDQFLKEADRILLAHDLRNLIHYNFMARGEPLDNPNVNSDLLLKLHRKTRQAYSSAQTKFLISTIFPKGVTTENLLNRFDSLKPDLYYSLYSVNPGFRNKWLPGAQPYENSLDTLAEWQQVSRKIPKIHFALIDGENDSSSDIIQMCKEIKSRKLRVDVNLVMFNPPDGCKYHEPHPERIEWVRTLLSTSLGPEARVDIVPRVGFDVKASCGMFVS